jgi:hypothetical protein
VGRQIALHKENSCPNSVPAHFHVSWLSDFIFYPKPNLVEITLRLGFRRKYPSRLGWRTDRKFLRNPNLNEIIRNPYINRFTNHFSIHSQPSYPQKVVLHSITARFCLRPYHFAVWKLKIRYVKHGGVYYLMSHYMTYFWDTRQNLCNFNSWRRMYNNPDEVIRLTNNHNPVEHAHWLTTAWIMSLYPQR